MNDSFGGGFSQSAAGENKAESKAEGILPVVIRQLTSQTDDVVTMFGMEYKMITIVATVKNIDHSTTKITYELEDLTGTIQAHFWMEEDDHRQPNVQLNTYVRVVGSLRTANQARSVMIFNIHPISGPNELNTHLLEVINARYVAEEYSQGGAGANASIFTKKENGLAKGNKMEVDSLTEDLDGLGGKDRTILDYIRQVQQDETGCARADILRRFPNIPPREINKMLDDMVTNGNIYSTVDQDHFMACF